MEHKDSTKGSEEWEDSGVIDDVYHKVMHTPCGTTVLILVGRVAVCPKCQPEEWAKAMGTKKGAGGGSNVEP